jgi:glycosyltransferase involved in cell wall biosynthesis
MTGEPSVSVLLPTLNERAFIRDCLDSLAAQDYTHLVEVLVVDGGSTDGTRDIAASVGGPVRLVDNPRVTAAAALNVGLDEAKGEVIVRADAHTLYERNYVRRCVEVLEETGAANVGGAMRPVGTTRFGRAVAAVTSSPLGVGPGKFHYAAVRTEVDTVYLGCWRRETIEALGGWDEANLQWGAEDHELNLRLHEAGGVIVLDPTIRSWYFPRDTPRGLWRQYRNYGLGKASTLAKHGSLPTWRPLAPAGLVAATVLLSARRRRAGLALVGVHLGLAAGLARRLARQPGVDVARTVAAVEICHWAYGIGFWQGVGRILRRRPFDSRPRGHR